VPRVRYFAQAREAAGTGREVLAGATVGEVLDAAVRLHGQRLAAVLPTAAVWLDGEPAERGDPVAEEAEVAILPPVSGGFAPLA
jgi:molybdopterin converting factor small subunit